MANRQQQQHAKLARGPAMPWAAAADAAAAPLAANSRAARGGLAPASMTFGLPLFWQQPQSQQQHARRPAPFASIGGASAPKLLFGAKQQESHTGAAFPAELCVLSARHCPGLAGVGVRAKRILGLKNINVYALGLYVDAAGAKRALGKWRGQDVAAEQQAYDAIIGADSFERSLRLVISFGGLKRQTFVDALEERLAPPLKKAGKADLLPKFQALFDNASFKKGTIVDFAVGGRGKLVTKIDGKQVGTIESPDLARALFGIYLGPDPVSADAKAAFGRGLSALLSE